MTAHLQQAPMPGNDRPHLPDFDSIPVTASGVLCHACDIVGGCLASRMMEYSGQVGLVRNNSRVLGQGENIFREGEEANALYVVRSGSVKSYLVTEDGEEQVLGFYLPGDVLGLDVWDPRRACLRLLHWRPHRFAGCYLRKCRSGVAVVFIRNLYRINWHANII